MLIAKLSCICLTTITTGPNATGVWTVLRSKTNRSSSHQKGIQSTKTQYWSLETEILTWNGSATTYNPKMIWSFTTMRNSDVTLAQTVRWEKQGISVWAARDNPICLKIYWRITSLKDKVMLICAIPASENCASHLKKGKRCSRSWLGTEMNIGRVMPCLGSSTHQEAISSSDCMLKIGIFVLILFNGLDSKYLWSKMSQKHNIILSETFWRWRLTRPRNKFCSTPASTRTTSRRAATNWHRKWRQSEWSRETGKIGTRLRTPLWGRTCEKGWPLSWSRRGRERRSSWPTRASGGSRSSTLSTWTTKLSAEKAQSKGNGSSS